MNCPHCQHELPENYAAAYCLFCGQDLSPIIPAGQSPKQSLAPIRFRAWVFFLMLLGPPILTMLSAWLVHAPNESYSVGIGFFGGGAAGIVCGIMLGLRLGKTIPARILQCLFFAAIMVVVCIMLCFFGCNLGGYQFRLH